MSGYQYNFAQDRYEFRVPKDAVRETKIPPFNLNDTGGTDGFIVGIDEEDLKKFAIDVLQPQYELALAKKIKAILELLE